MLTVAPKARCCQQVLVSPETPAKHQRVNPRWDTEGSMLRKAGLSGAENTGQRTRSPTGLRFLYRGETCPPICGVDEAWRAGLALPRNECPRGELGALGWAEGGDGLQGVLK